MKRYYILLLLTCCLIACTYEGSNFEEPTDFSEDISRKRNFYMENSIELTMENSVIEKGVANFNVGDTLKLSLKMPAIFIHKNNEFYNIFKSTGATKYQYSLYSKNSLFFDKDIIDLDFLENNSDIKTLSFSKKQIKESLLFHELYQNQQSIVAKYDSKSNSYVSNIGIVFTQPTTDPLTTSKDEVIVNSEIKTSTYIVNRERVKNIRIYVPIYSKLNFIKFNIQK